jgi:hypothetical protein
MEGRIMRQNSTAGRAYGFERHLEHAMDVLRHEMAPIAAFAVALLAISIIRFKKSVE